MPDTQMIDQEGIGFLIGEFSKIGCSVNEHHREVGIDCIIEIRTDEYLSSGKFIALQVKSGDSYLTHENEEAYYWYIDKAHSEYWLRCILPVFICIYSPIQKCAYYSIVNKNTLFDVGKNNKIEIKKNQKIPGLTKSDLLQVFYGKTVTLDECELLFKSLCEAKESITPNGKYISLLEIYISGLTEMCDALYFGTDLVSKICEYKTYDDGSFGFPRYVFFDEYFRLLYFYNILSSDFEFESQKIDNGLLPIFCKPFSYSGHIFNKYLESKGFKIKDRLFVTSTSNELEIIE